MNTVMQDTRTSEADVETTGLTPCTEDGTEVLKRGLLTEVRDAPHQRATAE